MSIKRSVTAAAHDEAVNANHRRRTSVYTIRLSPEHTDRIEAIRDAVEQFTPVVDVGAASVSFRTPTSDEGAYTIASTVMAGCVEEPGTGWTLTTGLGIHRRTVTA